MVGADVAAGTGVETGEIGTSVGVGGMGIAVGGGGMGVGVAERVLAWAERTYWWGQSWGC